MSRPKDIWGELRRESKKERSSLRNKPGDGLESCDIYSSANLDVIDAGVFAFFSRRFDANLVAAGDEDAAEGSGFPGMIIDVRRPRADHGAANAKCERRLAVVLVEVSDYDVVRSGWAVVGGPDVTERVRSRLGAGFAAEVVGLVVGFRQVLGLEANRKAADGAWALAGARFRKAPIGEKDGFVAQLRNAVETAVNAPLAPVVVIAVSPRVDRSAVPGDQRRAVAQPLDGELDVSRVRALVLHEGFNPYVAEERKVGLRLDAPARLACGRRPDDLQDVRIAGARSERD